MRIVLLHAPPWKIPDEGAPSDPLCGPPKGYGDTCIRNLDFLSIPYGLLSIAAQALRAGHEVQVLNIASFAWSAVERLVAAIDADCFGLTCFTSNRRGVAAVAEEIKRAHPAAHVVVGGPHATVLAREMLARHESIDSVVRGEGEETFLELLARLAAGQHPAGLPGLVCRRDGAIVEGEPRPRIIDLDSLAFVHDHFRLDALMTSRGCPGQCTFCASRALWGRRLRFHSVEAVLAMFGKAVHRQKLSALAIKDDTFTASKSRALAICEGLIERGLPVLWSCDTRVDCLDEELLVAMRKAGCQRISLGVESGSPEILARIKKRITPEQVVLATQLARRVGLEVRFYMMAGNRGETRETFRQSLELIERAGPSEALFCLLSIYPGSEEWTLLEESGVSRDVFFTHDFPEFELFAGNAADRDFVRREVMDRPLREVRDYSVEERKEVLRYLPELHSAALELGEALLAAGDLVEARIAVLRALDDGYPLPGQCFNALACIAAREKDPAAAGVLLDKALECYPHDMVLRNKVRLQEWFAAGGEASGRELELDFSRRFETTMPRQQPILPDRVVLKLRRR